VGEEAKGKRRERVARLRRREGGGDRNEGKKVKEAKKRGGKDRGGRKDSKEGGRREQRGKK